MSKRVRIVRAIRDADFGLPAFVFAHPDGNRIDLGQDIAIPERGASSSGQRDLQRCGLHSEFQALSSVLTRRWAATSLVANRWRTPALDIR